VHLVGVIIKKFVTMHGHMKVKNMCAIFIFSMVRSPFLFGDQSNSEL